MSDQQQEAPCTGTEPVLPGKTGRPQDPGKGLRIGRISIIARKSLGQLVAATTQVGIATWAASEVTARLSMHTFGGTASGAAFALTAVASLATALENLLPIGDPNL